MLRRWRQLCRHPEQVPGGRRVPGGAVARARQPRTCPRAVCCSRSCCWLLRKPQTQAAAGERRERRRAAGAPGASAARPPASEPAPTPTPPAFSAPKADGALADILPAPTPASGVPGACEVDAARAGETRRPSADECSCGTMANQLHGDGLPTATRPLALRGGSAPRRAARKQPRTHRRTACGRR